MTKDEKGAEKAWKEYHKAIKEFSLDEIPEHQGYRVNYMYDSFFAGFYAGRDYQKNKDKDHSTFLWIDEQDMNV